MHEEIHKYQSKHFFKKRHISWLNGKIAQWLEALVALLEDSGLILSIPMTAHSYL